MRGKLLDLMKNEGLKPSQLAELLEINPAGISHILAGRNKPGFDFLQKILRRFPRINPDWLLLDSDKMYRNDSDDLPKQPAPISSAAITDGLFGSIGVPPSTTPQAPTAAAASGMTSNISASETATRFPASRTDAAVQRVVIFYDDQTFESYTPTKR